MPRLPLAELAHRCQKPDHRRIGNWMARRISRPAALRITWVIAPWGISAHAATLAAWGLGSAAAAAFAWGTTGAWLLGAALLQIWYLLDHVDGQLARLRGTASLDGAQLDYLMHHTVHLVVPLGVGFGLFARWAEPWWLVAGLAWGLGVTLITLHHDARYKAFIGRLQRVQGDLLVAGGGGGRPEPQPPIPRQPLHRGAWMARKLCEIHVILNLLGLAALTQWLVGDHALRIGAVYVAVASVTAVAVAAWTILRSQQQQSAEREFAAWYRVPPGSEMIYEDGWWIVQETEGGQAKRSASITQTGSSQRFGENGPSP